MRDNFSENIPRESLEQMKTRLRDIEIAQQTAKHLGERDEVEELQSEIDSLRKKVADAQTASESVHTDETQSEESVPYSETRTTPPINPHEEIQKLKNLFKD